MRSRYDEIKTSLVNKIGIYFLQLLLQRITIECKTSIIESLKTKNKKLSKLIQDKVHKNANNLFKVLIVNLLSRQLTEKEIKHLQNGLKFSYINKNKHIKQSIAVQMESLAQRTSRSVQLDQLENYHEFLRSYTDKLVTIFIKVRITHITISSL